MLNLCSLLLCLGLVYSGLSAVVLAMPRHRDQIQQRCRKPLRHTLLYRSAAVICLSLALLTQIQVYGLGVGALYWLGIATTTCLLLTFSLSYFAHQIPLSFKVSAVLALISALACYGFS